MYMLNVIMRSEEVGSYSMCVCELVGTAEISIDYHFQNRPRDGYSTLILPPGSCSQVKSKQHVGKDWCI